MLICLLKCNLVIPGNGTYNLFQRKALQAEEEMKRGRKKLRYNIFINYNCTCFCKYAMYHNFYLLKLIDIFFIPDMLGSRFKALLVLLIRLIDKQKVLNSC